MTSTVKNLVLTCFLSVLSSGFSSAATYTSLTSGLWNNVTNVWSLDGITPCGCNPGTTVSGDIIVINHPVTTVADLILNGTTSLTVNAGGQLIGGNNIDISNATMDFFGPVSINRLDMGLGSVVRIHTGVIFNMGNQLQMTLGLMIVDGGLVSSGGADIEIGAQLVLLNAARFDVVTGNFKNAGLVDICGTCCMSSNGNWRNTPTGIVTGTGGVNSGGNLNNQGTWDVTVSWCATGTGLGLPIPEDCATAQGICFAIVLPVELLFFSANVVDNEFVDLNWATATELNSDYFEVERSNNGSDWEVIGKVTAAGTTAEKQEYIFTDIAPNEGTNYYRLIQFDLDGRESVSSVVAAQINVEGTPLQVYPNPASSSDYIVVNGIRFGDVLSIRNSSGGIALEQSMNESSNKMTLDISGLQAGMYFIHTELNSSNPVKLIVTR